MPDTVNMLYDLGDSWGGLGEVWSLDYTIKQKVAVTVAIQNIEMGTAASHLSCTNLSGCKLLAVSYEQACHTDVSQLRAMIVARIPNESELVLVFLSLIHI